MENTLHHLGAKHYQLRREYEAAALRLDWFGQKGITQAEIILETGKKSFQAGDIGLFEYIFMISEAFDLQMDYLEALNTHNQLVIHINQIFGR
jgi:cobalt-zinc-cadmium resistance protein CzcA